MKRVFFPILLLVLFVGSVFAQSNSTWWYTFEQGKQMYRRGDYGNALIAFGDAKKQRRAMYDRLERDFIDLLSISEVRRLGDSLDLIERYIRDYGHVGAADALRELRYRYPNETFRNSASAALTALGTLKEYPEADHWIGEIYLMEGELNLAIGQYQKVHDQQQRNLLANPDFAIETLYKIAAIRKTRQEYNEMERVLLSILSADKMWAGKNLEHDPMITRTMDHEGGDSFIKQSMTRTLESNGLNRFIVQYRYNSTEFESAHKQLGFYYYQSGRHAWAQEHLMFAFLIQNSVIIDELKRTRFNYTFETLDDLASQMNWNQVLTDYADKKEYYKTAYYLAASLYANGKATSARGIWSFLAQQSRAGEWQNRAIGQLRSPHIERALEMP
jgi:tetratricopeptide (TPR) repeat protein